ncbi:hypothetical protein ACI2LC_32930 [Nonomuraea wenchangensis]|uniref:hypothetical protein n=1 Tax=Nonomuraea wenchangensis TaxID=568860 RepID=UPI0033C5BB02
MDYYLISTSAHDRSLAGVLVEEFVLCEDFTAAGIDSAEWGSETGEWLAAPEVSRLIRSDGALRARVRPAGRRVAREAYARLGGGELPEEEELREHFRRRQPLPTTAPLRLGSGPDKDRRYRILFAGELGADGLAGAQAALRLKPTGDPRVVGTASVSAGGHGFSWELRRIGSGIAWCVDVTARLGGGSLATLEALLTYQRQAVRRQGLIPVTVERFA